MGLFSNFKRMYQWRCEHYLEALVAEDIEKRKAIIAEFMKCLFKNGVPITLIDGNQKEFEIYIIKQASKDPGRTIYEISEELASELKAPI